MFVCRREAPLFLICVFPLVFRSIGAIDFQQQNNQFVVKVENERGGAQSYRDDRTSDFWHNNVRSLLNRVPVPPTRQPQHDPFNQAESPRLYLYFPAPIILFENQIRNLIIQGRLSSGQNSTNAEQIDLRNDVFVDRNVAELLTTINHFDDLISMSKYSNERPKENATEIEETETNQQTSSTETKSIKPTASKQSASKQTKQPVATTTKSTN